MRLLAAAEGNILVPWEQLAHVGHGLFGFKLSRKAVPGCLAALSVLGARFAGAMIWDKR